MSSNSPGIDRSTEMAPHTLFKFRQPGSDEEGEEALSIRVFYDVSTLEIFLNDRTAISTRVYPESGTCYGIRPYLKGHSGDITPVLDFSVWPMQTRAVTQEISKVA